MKPLHSALLSAAAVVVLAGVAFFAAIQSGWVVTRHATPLPEGAGVITADNDIGKQVRDYLAEHPELLAANRSTAATAATAFGPFTPAQRTEINNIIRQTLLDNPEMIREAMDALDKKTADAEAAQQKTAIAQNKATLFNAPVPHQSVLGNPDGDVTLVEFFDYNCTYCRRAQADMERLVKEDNKLRVVIKEFPVLGPGSMEAAQVSVAINIVAPGKYAAFHDRMLTDTAPASGDRALAVAGAVGIDKEAVRTAMKDVKVTEVINEVYALANSLALTGTPSYVVGDSVVVGAVGYDSLKAKIEAVRACGSTTC